MFTIGELAAAAGTTTRAVRHYHSLGLLDEAARRSNGYREYDVQALLRLLRIRRLTQLGLSLPEVRDALSGDGEHELTEILTEVVELLCQQEVALREQRRQLTALLSRDHDLMVPAAVADVLADVRRQVSDEQVVRQESEVLELLEATMPGEQFEQVAAQYRLAISDPQWVIRGVALARRFQALATDAPDDSEVTAVAAEFVALGRDLVPRPTAGVSAIPSKQAHRWEAYRAALSPAQQSCLTLVAQEYDP